MPRAVATEDQVRAALEDILGWQDIARSEQLTKFLSYIVDARLMGQQEAIKAYSIAVDVFGRPPSFDPQSDPIVRVQARRLRALLDQFYKETEYSGPVRIRLPVGRYIPEFEVLPSPMPSPDAGGSISPAVPRPLPGTGVRGGRFGAVHVTGWGWGLAASVAALGVAVALVASLSPMLFHAVELSNATGPPKINILEFQNLTGEGGRKPVVGGLALELVTGLGLFGDIDAGYGQSPAESGSNPAQVGLLEPQTFVLSGIARITGGLVQYGAILKHNGSEDVVWSHAVSLPLTEAAEPELIDKVSRAMALMLGSHRGPLNADVRAWLAQQTDVPQIAGPYNCRLLFHVYRDNGLPADGERARTCNKTMIDAGNSTALILAAEGALVVDAVERGDASKNLQGSTMGDAQKLIATAVEMDPTSSFVWEQKARLQEAMGLLEAARSDYASALQLNPANDDALAGFGRMLAFTPDFALGADAAMMAVTGTPEPPPWYYTAPALNLLRTGQLGIAIRYAETVAIADRELGPIIAVVAGTAAGNTDVVNRYLPQVLEQPRFRALGILPRLRQRITDPALMTMIRNNLIVARVPGAALEAPF